MEQTSFSTLAGEARAELTRKGSRFIGVGINVQGKNELDDERERLDQEFPKATHIASGSIIIESGRPVERYDNDGEPSGTAGEPILQVIKGETLKNCAVFVVRYFGGTELGTGGLARAYSEATREVLERADIVLERERNRYLISFPYSFTGKIARVLAKFDGVDVLDRNYGRKSELEVSVPVDLGEAFFERTRSITAGEVRVERLESTENGT